MAKLMSSWPSLVLDLPGWLQEIPVDLALAPDERMPFVVEMARRNVQEQTGGPFAAAVFETASGRLVGPGTNRVVPTLMSFAHAEIMAIGVASSRVGTFDLGGSGLEPMELHASTEPCALCLGATVWSGVRKLVTGARDADARAIGFDEGPKIADWVAALEERQIAVVTDVERDPAVAVLREYQASGQIIYNGRRDA